MGCSSSKAEDVLMTSAETAKMLDDPAAVEELVEGMTLQLIDAYDTDKTGQLNYEQAKPMLAGFFSGMNNFMPK